MTSALNRFTDILDLDQLALSTGLVSRSVVTLFVSWRVPNKVGTNTDKMGIIWDESINERAGSAIAWRGLFRIIIYFELPAGPGPMPVPCLAFPHLRTQARARKRSLLCKTELQITFSYRQAENWKPWRVPRLAVNRLHFCCDCLMSPGFFAELKKLNVWRYKTCRGCKTSVTPQSRWCHSWELLADFFDPPANTIPLVHLGSRSPELRRSYDVKCRHLRLQGQKQDGRVFQSYSSPCCLALVST